MNLSLAKAEKLLRRYWLPLSLALIGLIFFAYGLIYLFSLDSQENEIRFETNSQSNQDFSQKTIIVDIEGEVVKPGVYKLRENAIVQDGLIAAGGMSKFADRDWVAKNLNLALKLADGQKVYIPKIGETEKVLSSTTTSNSPALININQASEKELDSLPGIGLVTAAKIINARPYSAIEDLINKKIVTSKVYSQIKDKIVAQ
jgi:competence protein ComEA